MRKEILSLSLSLSKRLCMQNEDSARRSFSCSSPIFIELSFLRIFFFSSSFFARICVCGVDNIVSVYRPIYRLDKSTLIAVYVNRIDRCIATRKYSLQSYKTCYIAFDIFLICIVSLQHTNYILETFLIYDLCPLI